MKPVEPLAVPCPVCEAVEGAPCRYLGRTLAGVRGLATSTGTRTPHGQRKMIAAVAVARAALQERRP